MLYCFAGSSTIVHNFSKADATNDTHAYVCLYVLNIYMYKTRKESSGD